MGPALLENMTSGPVKNTFATSGTYFLTSGTFFAGRISDEVWDLQSRALRTWDEWETYSLEDVQQAMLLIEDKYCQKEDENVRVT